MYGSFCYNLHKMKQYKVICVFLLFFIVFSAFIMPIQQAQAVVFIPAAYAGASIIYDLCIGGLITGGVVAADTYIKKSDTYKFVSSYLQACTTNQVERLIDLGSGASTIVTNTISDLMAKMLGTFGAQTITVQNCDARPAWFPPSTAIKGAPPAGTYFYLLSYDMNFHLYDLHVASNEFVFEDTMDEGKLTRKFFVSDATLGKNKCYYVNGKTSDFSARTNWGFSSVSEGCTLVYHDTVLNRLETSGTVTLGDVVTSDFDLGKSISLSPSLSIPFDVPVCDESWANDDTYKVAYPPWLADMEGDLAGDVIITPDLTADGDIGGDTTLTPDGNAITGAISGLLNWLKGILQSIWEAIKAIPVFIASLFDVSQFSLDFAPLKNMVIKDKFPFCIPFDFYNAVKSFAVSASDYKMDIDLETAYFEIHHQVDLSAIALPIAFFRYVACVWFALILIFRTRDLMKW